METDLDLASLDFSKIEVTDVINSTKGYEIIEMNDTLNLERQVGLSHIYEEVPGMKTLQPVPGHQSIPAYMPYPRLNPLNPQHAMNQLNLIGSAPNVIDISATSPALLKYRKTAANPRPILPNIHRPTVRAILPASPYVNPGKRPLAVTNRFYQSDSDEDAGTYSDVITYSNSEESEEDPEAMPYDPIMRCTKCEFMTVHTQYLREHKKRHPVERPYKCNKCNYRSAQKGNLKTHLRTHTGIKPFKCGICPYSASQSASITRHRRTHTGEKPYKCDMCSFVAARLSTVQIHRRSHTGEKPYVCDKCDYRSTQYVNLKLHKRIHTGEKPFKCSQCDYRAARSLNLKVHALTHINEKPFKCDHCDYSARQFVLVRKHKCKHLW